MFVCLFVPFVSLPVCLTSDIDCVLQGDKQDAGGDHNWVRGGGGGEEAAQPGRRHRVDLDQQPDQSLCLRSPPNQVTFI